MAVTIQEKNVKNTDKGFRVDCKVESTGFFSGVSETKFFFMGSGDFNEDLLEQICEEVIERKDKWEEKKRSHTLRLNTIRSTAIITHQEQLD